MHNDLVLRAYEDLARWARDELKREGVELDEMDEDMNKQNLFYSGARGKREREIREKYAHRWRDRKSEAEGTIRDVKYRENWMHASYRKAARKPWPTNPWQDEIARLTHGWEAIIGG